MAVTKADEKTVKTLTLRRGLFVSIVCKALPSAWKAVAENVPRYFYKPARRDYGITNPMRKAILIAVLSIVMVGCTSTKKVMNSWLGHSKHDVIMGWGPPSKVSSDGNGGKCLLFSPSIWIHSHKAWLIITSIACFT